MTYDIVDLGTKHGNAIDEVLKNEQLLKPENCIGYELTEHYRQIVQQKHYQFRCANLADDNVIATLPLAKIYLAWHFLEHMPNKEWARKIVQAALTNAHHMAWFRLPSFQQDDTGEGALRKHGMRYTWTNWRGHPTHWLIEDCQEVIEKCDRQYNLTIKPAGYVRSMADSRVVPIDTPTDVTRYHSDLGPKPNVILTQPIVSEWDVVVRFDENKN
jgi:hypothetical protein